MRIKQLAMVNFNRNRNQMLCLPISVCNSLAEIDKQFERKLTNLFADAFHTFVKPRIHTMVQFGHIR